MNQENNHGEGQDSTFQLVTVGPLPEGPIHQVKNMTILEKYTCIFYNSLPAKLVFILESLNFAHISRLLRFIFHLSILFWSPHRWKFKYL